MLECNNEKIRLGIAELIIHILTILAPYEYSFFTDVEIVSRQIIEKDRRGEPELKIESVKQYKSFVIRFMEGMLNLLEESRTFWRKFRQFFYVIRRFAMIGNVF